MPLFFLPPQAQIRHAASAKMASLRMDHLWRSMFLIATPFGSIVTSRSCDANDPALTVILYLPGARSIENMPSAAVSTFTSPGDTVIDTHTTTKPNDNESTTPRSCPGGSIGSSLIGGT